MELDRLLLAGALSLALGFVFFILPAWIRRRRNRMFSKRLIGQIFAEPSDKVKDYLKLWGLDRRAVVGGVNTPVIVAVVGSEHSTSLIFQLLTGNFKNPPETYVPRMTVDEAIIFVRKRQEEERAAQEELQRKQLDESAERTRIKPSLYFSDSARYGGTPGNEEMRMQSGYHFYSVHSIVERSGERYISFTRQVAPVYSAVSFIIVISKKGRITHYYVRTTKRLDDPKPARTYPTANEKKFWLDKIDSIKDLLDPEMEYIEDAKQHLQECRAFLEQVKVR